MIMTRKLLFTAFAVLVALVVTSCGSTNEPTRYPDTLVGFWANTPDAEGQWYGLDVVDATSANLITYEGAEEIQTEAFQLTYTASNGKGTLVGDGRSPKIQVINDTTLTILMASGEVSFTKASKPVETFSLTGGLVLLTLLLSVLVPPPPPHATIVPSRSEVTITLNLFFI